MKFNKNEIIRLWGNGLTIRFNYQDYEVKKMSYGQYFLEPVNCGLSETEGFHKNTLWLKNNEKNINILEIDLNDIKNSLTPQ